MESFSYSFLHSTQYILLTEKSAWKAFCKWHLCFKRSIWPGIGYFISFGPKTDELPRKMHQTNQRWSTLQGSSVRPRKSFCLKRQDVAHQRISSDFVPLQAWSFQNPICYRVENSLQVRNCKPFVSHVCFPKNAAISNLALSAVCHFKLSPYAICSSASSSVLVSKAQITNSHNVCSLWKEWTCIFTLHNYHLTHATSERKLLPSNSLYSYKPVALPSLQPPS